ncbi:hypothetical protein [Ferruginibacter sp. HRS2-29]|uniref:hypothetical protein n=1 Tax=Ferruginibacter sp. HRS2-29 TaxID=2487334 RepID=UPI0020CF8241|nr:hypothetical protein [Ferruginibacter sp. HRS2-29]MCP9751360.1 hypothetical protein [Ferruginibacter sp. HRS2-29]
MRKAYKYTGAVVLILLFSIKLVAQAFSIIPPIQKSLTEQQEGKSAEDNCLEKSTNQKADFIPVNFLRSISISSSSTITFLAISTHKSLPAQYFAIPTPPPWNC